MAGQKPSRAIKAKYRKRFSFAKLEHLNQLFIQANLLLLPIASPIRAFSQQEPLVTLTGHSTGLRAVAFSPDGKILASADNGDTIRIWDVASWTEKAVLVGNKELRSIAFSLDGKILAAGMVKAIKIWDVASGKELATLEDVFCADCMAFSPDGKTLIASESHEAKIWDVATRKAQVDSRW